MMMMMMIFRKPQTSAERAGALQYAYDLAVAEGDERHAAQIKYDLDCAIRADRLQRAGVVGGLR